MEDLEGCISNTVGTFLIAIAFTLLSGVINLAGISLTFRIILFSFIFILIFIWIIRKGRKIISKDDTLPKKDPLPKVDLFLEEFEKKYPRVNPYMQNFENASADLSGHPSKLDELKGRVLHI